MKLTIDYPPTPKGVPRFKFVKSGGKSRIITYYHWKTTEALENIRALLTDMHLEPFPKHTPVKLTVTFYRTKSKWLPKREKTPFRKPDLDNFLKLTIDTISGILVPDDAQFTSIYAKKRWSDKEYGYITIQIEEDTP